MNQSRISAQEFIHQHQTQKLTVIDLRTPAEINSEYLEGCLNLPLQELSKESLQKLLDKNGHQNAAIHLLCQSGRRADTALKQLGDDIPHKLLVIEGGLEALRNAGSKILSRGGKVIALDRQIRIAAGSLVSIGILLGLTAHSYFIFLALFVGLGLVFSGITNTCAMGMFIARMPWNK